MFPRPTLPTLRAVNALPEFEITTRTNMDLPHSIRMRFIDRANRNNAFDVLRIHSLANQMRSAVYEFVLTARPFTRSNLNNVAGYIQGENVDGNSSIFDKRIRVEDITPEMFYGLMERIHESNALVKIKDIIWTFLIDPITLMNGGSPRVTMPRWVKPTFKPTWDRQCRPGTDTPINCAAFTLAWLDTEDRTRHYKRVVEKAVWLEQQMELSGFCSIDELERYVQIYPERRLTILQKGLARFELFTFTGANFVLKERPVEQQKDKNMVYLFYDREQNHFAYAGTPAQVFETAGSTDGFCHKCVSTFKHGSTLCLCHTRSEQQQVKAVQKQKRQISKIRKPCVLCEEIGDHKCPLAQCNTCKAIYKRGYDVNRGTGHRCIVYNDSAPLVFMKPGDPDGKKKYKLWAYDFESCVEYIETQTREFVLEDGKFKVDEQGEAIFYWVKQGKHKVNLVVCRDVFDPTSEKVYRGENCLRDFICDMVSFNDGKNVVVAHNGSGYDARLILDEIALLDKHERITPVARGSKFMQIQIGKTFFRDSLLHLQGSLASLSDAFLGKGQLKKGDFPHRFNEQKNYGYVGPLPDKKYFELGFKFKTSQHEQEFHEWHDTYSGVWDFDKELLEYCKNDVEILARVMVLYHEQMTALFDVSPWNGITAPSYLHGALVSRLSKDLELPEDKKERHDKIQELASDKIWAVLTPMEYWFIRLCLRGGRTDVRKIYHHVSDEDWDRGVRIVYIDVKSMYPYVQIAYPYPVGTPTIYIYDKDFYPCNTHRNPENGGNVLGKCDCSYHVKKLSLRGHLQETIIEDVFDNDNPWPEVGRDDWFGFVCVTLDPPKDLFHPVLVNWDPIEGKCVATLNQKTYYVPSFLFKIALEQGYKLIRMHRFDKYAKKDGLWNDVIRQLYVIKEANSGPMPSTTIKRNELIEMYDREPFNMGQLMFDSFGIDEWEHENNRKRDGSPLVGKWGFNPAARQTAKIGLNSLWGKHCERANMPTSLVLTRDDEVEMLDLFQKIATKNTKMQDNIPFGNDKLYMKIAKCTGTGNPNLHKAYLPAGVMVPSYGQLMLWTQMNKVGKQCLYHDTDSIIYVHDPAKPDQCITPGEMWGDWEYEKFGKGKLRTFVGIGPKSYGLRSDDGKEMFKWKGVSVSTAHGEMLNLKRMEVMVKEYLERATEHTIVEMPQFTMVYKIGVGIVNNFVLKKCQFNKTALKGNLAANGVLYPFGYCHGCILEDLGKENNPLNHTCKLSCVACFDLNRFSDYLNQQDGHTCFWS